MLRTRSGARYAKKTYQETYFASKWRIKPLFLLLIFESVVAQHLIQGENRPDLVRQGRIPELHRQTPVVFAIIRTVLCFGFALIGTLRFANILRSGAPAGNVHAG